jgi:hypothetical protein
LKEAED